MDALRKQAKRWLRALRGNDDEARARLERADPTAPPIPTLRDVQHALAREYGYENWAALKRAHEDVTRAAEADTPLAYARLVRDLLVAFNDREATALAAFNARYGLGFTLDDLDALVWGMVYAFRQRSSRSAERYLLPAEAQIVIAQLQGYPSWEALIDTGPARPARVPAYEIDERDSRIAPRRVMTGPEWDEFLDLVRSRQIACVDGGGQISDGLMARIAECDHVTRLVLAGSRRLTDDGLQHLARMPQLEHLELSAYPGGRFTDAGLAVLRELASLRTFEMTWQRGVSDAGVRHLAACGRLERVNVMGSTTGDGLIQAMAGKEHLRSLQTGRLVTDAGLASLREVPLLGTAARDGDDGPVSLLIDGPFSDVGFGHVRHLQGLIELDLFWHVTALTSAAFAELRFLEHLATLGADGALSDDLALQHFAAIPRLRALRAQEAAATDAGFEALSRSTTLERFWGRDCERFGSRGFMAFSRLPRLLSLGVGLKHVDDAALAHFSDFRALRELTPIGLQDEGFRHVGRCRSLERLTCMYCRESGDAATRHVATLPLKHYYAGLTQITDASLEVLGRMDTLEGIELYECQRITDGGLPALARLPRLREVSVGGSKGVTHAGMRVFPARVRVRYST